MDESKNLLQVLLRERMDGERLSYRDVAAETGVSHTTVGRVYNGHTVDIPTLYRLCKWLGVTPSYVLGMEEETDDLGEKFAAIIGLHPELREVLKEAIERFEAGKISHEVVSELVAYIAFRLKMVKSEA